MLVSAVTLGCALLLGQTEVPAVAGPEAPVEAPVEANAVLSSEPPRTPGPWDFQMAIPDAASPQQSNEGQALCLPLPPTPAVPSGQWRARCDDARKECLVSPAHELDSKGHENDQPLQRVDRCLPLMLTLEKALEYRLVPAIAEAPPGWYRDERGRVLQYNFDLHRRVRLGGAWAPRWLRETDGVDERVRVDFGVDLEWPGESDRLHRMTLLDTELYLGDAASYEATLLRYDFRSQNDAPLFRVTTFYGRARRFDVHANLGFWMEVLHGEQVRREDVHADFLSLAATHVTLDLWHSEDLVSYVRVRAGPSVERDRTNGFFTLVPAAALEGDLTLDRDGFHHVRFGAEAQKVLLAERVEGRPLRPERLRLRAGYEVIALAINDQPVSLTLDGRGTWRDDVANAPAGWEWSAQAGLRFSLWAPARRSAPASAPGKG
ncbi:hypothetical protein [Corallococcus aberystwythensis]|uniref:Uncharacterized protein n=1 Tax=Corallococcus aberystwythensis TaxID=2316722 RepID=A0A3A8PZ46_9BACT|nr:hypothetical protein [Corallococcus aberystwythensis]RKH59075.1 hypothetical protein D7W81_27965 [Corallococcus aberystwythensis]